MEFEWGLTDRWGLDIWKIRKSMEREKAFYTKSSERISFISETINKFSQFIKMDDWLNVKKQIQRKMVLLYIYSFLTFFQWGFESKIFFTFMKKSL